MGELIDTTEMYLKTILEMEEDGVTPLRARIVERLDHSGPTVSQTVARMERDGLVHVLGDRRLELTEEGRRQAIDVLKKHRIAERLLVDGIGLDWALAHEEACRWEHVMSDRVQERLVVLLSDPETDPYGNAIPGRGAESIRGESVEVAVRTRLQQKLVLVRIGEPLQADAEIIADFSAAGLRPGAELMLEDEGDFVRLRPLDASGVAGPGFCIPLNLAAHLFVRPL